jgi:PilZ domain
VQTTARSNMLMSQNMSTTDLERHPSTRSIVTDLGIELVQLGYVTAITGSLANASVQVTTPSQLLKKLRAFMPVNQNRLAELSRQLSGDLSEVQLSQAVQSLCVQLHITLTLTNAVGDTSATDRYAHEPMIDAWRRLAGTCYVVTVLVEGALERYGGPNKRSSNQPLLQLLKAVSAGQHPCVQPDGVVSVPQRAERRSDTRRSIRQTITVHSTYGAQFAELFNLSARGAMISTLDALMIEDQIALSTHEGTQIGATIVWDDGERMGIRFLNPIDPTTLVQNGHLRQ